MNQHQQIDPVAAAAIEAGQGPTVIRTHAAAFHLGRYTAAKDASAEAYNATGSKSGALHDRLERDACAALHHLQAEIARSQPMDRETAEAEQGGTDTPETEHPWDRVTRARRALLWLELIHTDARENELGGYCEDARAGLVNILEYIRRDLEAADPHFEGR